MKFIINSLGYISASTILFLIFWNQLEICFNKNNSFLLYIVNLFFAIMASNCICIKLDSIILGINDLLEKKEDK